MRKIDVSKTSNHTSIIFGFVVIFAIFTSLVLLSYGQLQLFEDSVISDVKRTISSKTEPYVHNMISERSHKLKNVINTKMIIFAGIGGGFITLISFIVLNHVSLTQRKLVRARFAAERLIQYDMLTGLPNHSYIKERTEQAFSLADRTSSLSAIMMIDLNEFKLINETLGEEVGDEIIVQVSQRLQETKRRSDIVARMGGDKFAALMYTVESRRSAEQAAERFISAFYEPFYVNDQPIIISINIGIAIYPYHSTSDQELLKCAEIAMNKAKQDQMGYAVCKGSKELSEEQSLKTATMMAYLRKSVEHKELELYYQPKFNIKENRIDSVEALIRWNHPQLGLVSPDEFIPLAEKSGFIRDITMWVIAEGLDQLAIWKNKGIDLKLSLNVSPQCLYCVRLMNLIIQKIKEHNIDPHQLTLEITETAIMTNADTAIKILLGLTQMGIKLSIDDFGTGHSSLMYLQTLPVSEIKIDKSFVSNLTSHTKNVKIVKSIISLAHSIDCVAVAEGVETERDQFLLEEMQCDYIQGYYISKPITARDIEMLFGRNGA